MALASSNREQFLCSLVSTLLSSKNDIRDAHSTGDCCPLLSIVIHCCQWLSILIQCCRLLSIVVNCSRISFLNFLFCWIFFEDFCSCKSETAKPGCLDAITYTKWTFRCLKPPQLMVWKSDFFKGSMRFVRVPPYESWANLTNFFSSWENGDFFWGQKCCTLFHTQNVEK